MTLEQIKAKRKELEIRSEYTQNEAELRDILNQLKELNRIEAELREPIAGGNTIQNERFSEAHPGDEERGQRFNAISTFYSAPQGQLRSLGSYNMAGNGQQLVGVPHVKELEQRGADLAAGKEVQIGLLEVPELRSRPEFRALTLASGGIGIQDHNSATITPGFSQVSSIVDMINFVPLFGGESYTQSYGIDHGVADYAGEGMNYADIDPKTGKVKINKTKLTAYFEIDEAVLKLAPSAFMVYAQEAAWKAIRRKIGQEIILGDGAADHMTGIYHAPTTILPTSGDLPKAAVDGLLTRELMFDLATEAEEIPGGAVLILNKKDLKALSEIATSSGQLMFQILLNDNNSSGTISTIGANGAIIDSLRFVINNSCNDLASATVGQYGPVYGVPGAYTVPVFSDIDVQISTEHKFRTGQVAVRASMYLGGALTMKDAFVRVKKA